MGGNINTKFPGRLKIPMALNTCQVALPIRDASVIAVALQARLKTVWVSSVAQTPIACRRFI